jgi:tetratricopeptide (TPR) repeat protein
LKGELRMAKEGRQKTIHAGGRLVVLLAVLIVALSSCAQLLPTHRDEDVLSPATRVLPVHKDEDVIPAATKLLPWSRNSSNTVSIGERGRNSKAVEWLRQSTRSLEKGNWPEAVRTAEAAITLEPGMDDAYVNRGLAYYRENMADQAIADCGRAISLNANNMLAYACRGLAGKREERHASGSDADLARAFQLSKVPVSPVIIGDREDETAKFQAACFVGLAVGCAQYKKLTGRYPADAQKRLNVLLDESYVKFVAKDWDSVVRKTTDVLMIDEDNVVALCNRSGAYANKGLLKEAMADANTAISTNPDFVLAYNNRGWIKELSLELKGALIDYEAACSRGLKLACTNAARLRATGKVR